MRVLPPINLPLGPAPWNTRLYSSNPIESPGNRGPSERETAGSNSHLKQQQHSSVGSLALPGGIVENPTRYSHKRDMIADLLLCPAIHHPTPEMRLIYFISHPWLTLNEI